jgi:hypothetical protein
MTQLNPDNAPEVAARTAPVRHNGPVVSDPVRSDRWPVGLPFDSEPPSGTLQRFPGAEPITEAPIRTALTVQVNPPACIPRRKVTGHYDHPTRP